MIVNNCCMIMLTLLTLILLLQNVIFDLLPTISAIDASLVPSLMSINLCMVILNDSFNKILSRILSMTIFKTIRNIIRVSYLFHPIIFELCKILIPWNNSNMITHIMHMFLTFLFHFVVCFFIEKYLEKPLIIYSNYLLKFLFKKN